MPGSSAVTGRSPSEPVAPRTVGLALGSGSARGLAHIGVLRAIREAGIDIKVIAGTSMGALIGAVLAAGGLDSLTAKFLGLDWKYMVSLLDPVFPRSGLIDGRKIADFVRTLVPDTAIEDLNIPFAAVATDLATGREVVIDHGDLTEAVRASIAVPGIFTPVRRDGHVLVDGGLVDPVPVSAARAMGADLVIAVDLNHDIVAGRSARVAPSDDGNGNGQTLARLLESLPGAKNTVSQNPLLAQFSAWLKKDALPGIFEVLLASLYIMQARITQSSLRHDRPDLLIQPPLGAVRLMDFGRAEEIIEIGYRCATERLKSWPQATDRPHRLGRESA
ncbi:MAG: hypothetical protein AMXMBFR6_22970 [Betaproteobacteria bacterium]|nr:patatin-like phospholipase family protein [Rhodocyclaceae bacterium]MCG3186711.1 putative NTE family protein [Rhodocyclaceae bacterium]